MTDAALLPAGAAPLPIDATLPALVATLRAHGVAVLQAPPGAGKTTRVPLALLAGGIAGPAGRIVMLEPRRLAARAAAERMAETLGEGVGATIGYRMRGEARTSAATRIEVVTEGILTRMIQSDPALDGIAALVFDEFHERSLNADLGLALAWEARAALRPDLAVVVMSATLDAAPVAAMLGAPVLTAHGRAFPVETEHLATPRGTARLEDAVAEAVLAALPRHPGGVLAFLPGAAEIARTAARLGPRLPPDCDLRPLYGAMDFAAQHAAIAPAPAGRRKVVLATAIAETSLTIEDVRIVVDGGLARRSRFDPASGMSRLVTERAARAEADQRRGRAGRVAPGLCLRLWTKGEEGGMQAFAPPEIETADLAPLALDLAQWGARGGEGLAFLTPPAPGPLAEARALLALLGALDASGATTAHGRALAGLPLHPRLGHMLLKAGRAAAPLAALLSERDLLRGAPADLSLRLKALADPRAYAAEHPWPLHRPTLDRLRPEVRRLARLVPARAAAPAPAGMAALAYPDRVGLRRPGGEARWLLSGGKGAAMDPADPLAGARLIVATDLDGDPREARIRQAVALPEAELRALYPDRLAWRQVCEWSRRERRVMAREREMFGAIAISERIWQSVPPAAVAAAACEGLRALGLDATGRGAAFRRLQARAAVARAGDAASEVPDIADAALLDTLEDWLAAWLGACRTAADLAALDPTEALRARLGHAALARIEALAPAHFETPLGRRVAIDYDGDVPGVAVRVQEMFGLTVHPAVGPDRRPLRLTLLSPGGQPVQVTTDLPGFWAGAWAEVRREMRGRYPRHPWPENPAEAAPTTRARPRGT